VSVPIVFVDTETDGVHPGRKVWEVAIIRREPDGTEQEWTAFVDLDLSTSDPFGLKVGRFYERHPAGRALAEGREHDPWHGPAPLNPFFTARKVAQLTHGAHWVGMVPNFDTEVLAALLREHRLAPAWHYHLVDAENLAAGWLRGQGLRAPIPWKSDELSRAVGVEPPGDDDRHTALGDARWAKRIYDVVMGQEQGR